MHIGGYKDSEKTFAAPLSYEYLVPTKPAIVSIIGWHGGESADSIVARKTKDIVKAGQTLWVFQSWKAKTEAVQAFGRDHAGATVYFIEGGASPAGTAQPAIQMSTDRRKWTPLPEGIGAVTGKLGGGTALVLEKLETCSGGIDLWCFEEYPKGEPVRFMQGASTACLVPASEIAVGMKSRFRRVVAIGRLAEPFAVYLR